jgi:hypothetical protein
MPLSIEKGHAGGLTEPSVVPRFIAALQKGGAVAKRVAAYVTRQGVSADDIMPEAALMRGGCIDAICFTSSAEAQGLVNALGGCDVLQALLSDHGTHAVSENLLGASKEHLAGLSTSVQQSNHITSTLSCVTYTVVLRPDCQSKTLILQLKRFVVAEDFTSTSDRPQMTGYTYVEWFAGIALAAHGPYTAAGVAAVTDMEVSVIGAAYGSFQGVVNALAAYFDPMASSSCAEHSIKDP